MNDFEGFVNKASEKISDILEGKQVEEKKRKLFEYIHTSNDSMTLKQLAKKSFWTSWQINRDFKRDFGISLKNIAIS